MPAKNQIDYRAHLILAMMPMMEARRKKNCLHPEDIQIKREFIKLYFGSIELRVMGDKEMVYSQRVNLSSEVPRAEEICKTHNHGDCTSTLTSPFGRRTLKVKFNNINLNYIAQSIELIDTYLTGRL